jgi:D-3-phosphoglycerate dehydrogenase
MATARDIAQRPERTVLTSLSVSPTATMHSPSSLSFASGGLANRIKPKQLKPFNTTDIKILLLENVNQSGRDLLTQQGYQVEFLKCSLPEDQLIEKIR